MTAPAGYVKIWGDDFATSNLDTTNWWTRYVYDNGMLDYLNDEVERFRENGNHVMTGSSLKLTALPKGADGLYPSGMIRSKTCFNLNAGIYIEARIKQPPGKGAWTGFWLVPGANPDGSGPAWPPEIDIQEFVNNVTDDNSTMFNTSAKVGNWAQNADGSFGAQHLQNTYAIPGFNGQFNVWYSGIDFTKAFHTIGFLYENGAYSVFCDGKLILSQKYIWCDDNGKPSPDANILFDFAIGGQWAGRYGIDDTAFPQAFEIDYVHVFQKEATSICTIGQDLMPNGG